MLYLASFSFPDQEDESSFFDRHSLTCFDTHYPFQVLGGKDMTDVRFEPLTIFYGGNGCGKTTALNVIAEALELKREACFNQTVFFKNYLKYCDYQWNNTLLRESKIITSDDVFDHLFRVRQTNEHVDMERQELFERYTENRRSGFRMDSLEDYAQLREVNRCRKLSKSEYIRQKKAVNIRGFSNGETALNYFYEHITEDSLYLLDEPENSLSAENQQKLAQFLEDSCRFYNCQFIISTHSPFLLALKGARIYDMEEAPVRAKKWTELKNVRIFHDFFVRHTGEF